ncbi:MAG: geranylgeranylglyceryl/heptaprenylglyceryl phosphate synthase [Candidatus Altiarchaeota archaeon]
MSLIKELLEERKRALHFTLIDPEDQSIEEAGKRAKLCEDFGTDAIMVGGSTIKESKIVDETIKEIKENSSLPVILFPNSATAVSQYADYIFFMSMLNSKERKYLLEEQLKGALLVKKFKLKVIPLAYLVISTSVMKTEVERASELDIIKIYDIPKALNYALIAKYFGFSCIYLEAGSGAEHPIANEMIYEIKKEVRIPIIVGGGIRNARVAREKVKAGADVIVTGTMAEENLEKVKEIIQAIKKF